MQQLMVVCIGAGTIGRGWACAFLAQGHRVRLVDRDSHALRQAQADIARSLAIIQPRGDTPVPRAAENLSVGTELERSLEGADYIQESIVEDVAAKREVFVSLDRLCGDNTIIGSSTSAIAGSAFMGELSISPRCLVVHPTNPPYLVPLIELCGTPWTSQETLARTESMLRAMGKTPVRIRRELPGYALNRLQAAVVGEALHLIGEGFISPEDLDRVMTDGLGFRWCVAGPFLTGHLNAPGGYLDYMTRYGHVYRELIRELRIDYAWAPRDIAEADAMIREASGDCAIDDLQDWRDGALNALRPVLARIAAAKPGKLP